MMHDPDNANTLDIRLVELGLGNESRLKFCRCSKVRVVFSLGAQSLERSFGRRSTVGEVKSWFDHNNLFDLGGGDPADWVIRPWGASSS